MLTRQASPALAKAPQPQITRSLASVSEQELRQWVERLALPRHFDREPEENKTAGSQRVPPGLPVQVSDRGNFLALLANHSSYRGIRENSCRHYSCPFV